MVTQAGNIANDNLNTDQQMPKSQNRSKLDELLHKHSQRFCKFMVKYPYVNIILVLILFIWAAVIGFVPKLGAQKLPNFAEPTKGFMPRDTTISNRDASLKNLAKSYTAGNLKDRPFPSSVRSKRSPRAVRLVSACSTYGISHYVDANKVIYEHKTGGNLLDVDRLKEMCRLHERVVISNANYKSFVRKYSSNLNCPSFSIATYIALHNNRTTCSQITNADVTSFMSVMKQCVASYKNGGIKSCIDDFSKCSSLPAPCNSYETANVVYNIFYYLSDTSFAENPDFLKLALVSDSFYSPYSDGIIDSLYKSVYETQLKDLSAKTEGNVRVSAFEFWNLKFKTFNTQLLLEGAFLTVAMVVVLIFIIIYSGSIFIGLMTFLCIIIAAVMAYFCYGIIFRLSFFPFLNVLTFVFLVGIGADDAFVFMGAWKEAKRLMPRTSEKTFEESLMEWTAYSLKHATVAMFVTSLTTASAFYANATSKIIAVRCFGVYAGTCILLNYFLMVVWFPVAVIISEKYFSPCMAKLSPKCCPDHASVIEGPERETSPHGPIAKCWSSIGRMSRNFFEVILPKVISKLKYVFIVLFIGLGIGGLIALFVKPKLGLPISSEFIMFSPKHSLEQYPLNYKSKFSFGKKGSSWFMPLYIVFGVQSKNTANMMNPDDKGRLELKSSCSISTKEEQIWLKNFCTNLQNATFVDKSASGTCKNILQLWSTLNSPCGVYPTLNAPCCNRTIPISQTDFDHCLINFTRLNPTSSMSGLLYDRGNKPRALVIHARSTFLYSDSYDKSNKLFNQLESWMTNQMRDAPASFSDGWWNTELSFYDLQNGLATGTQISLGVSVAIAFAVVLFTTWNVLISIYSIICIICVISVSVGILVLAGWRLNILESIIFSVAAGLSVDFTLHYGVAYRTATEKGSRKGRVRYSLVHLGSAVTMGAITTFISGLVMAPATVLVYIQLSHFLMTLMTFSWLYATLFFLSLCAAIGPTNNFCQLSLSSICFCSKDTEEEAKIEANQNTDHEEHEMNQISAAKA